MCCLVGADLKEVMVDKTGKAVSMRDEPKSEPAAGAAKAKEEPKKPENPPKKP